MSKTPHEVTKTYFTKLGKPYSDVAPPWELRYGQNCQWQMATEGTVVDADGGLLDEW